MKVRKPTEGEKATDGPEETNDVFMPELSG